MIKLQEPYRSQVKYFLKQFKDYPLYYDGHMKYYCLHAVTRRVYAETLFNWLDTSIILRLKRRCGRW